MNMPVDDESELIVHTAIVQHDIGAWIKLAELV